MKELINSIPEKYYYAKIRYSEILAIIKKRPFFEKVNWSDIQQREFDDFWTEHYGKKIKNWWNRLYESMNGVPHKDYFPEMLYSVALEPAINPLEYCRIFDNKSLLRLLYGGVDEVVFPETLLLCCNGTYCDGKGKLYTKTDAAELLGNIGPCIIKPTVDTGSGSGVKVLDMENGTDRKSGKTAGELISEYGKSFIVQEKIVNSTLFREINPAAVNTIRLITYIVGDEIHNAVPVMRIGVGGNEVDNIHRGGLCVGIEADGTLKEKAYQLGYGDNSTVFTAHPDTGVVFRGHYVCDIGKVIAAAKKMHSLTPHVGMISWDLTVDKKDNVVLIEANCRGQSVWFPQIVNECPIFGDDTPIMIQKMKK